MKRDSKLIGVFYVFVVIIIGYMAFSYYKIKNVFYIANNTINLSLDSKYKLEVLSTKGIISNLKFKYNSSDNSIATVSKDGLITPHKGGEVTIKVTSKSTFEAKKVKLKVIDDKVELVDVDKQNVVMYVGDTYSLKSYINNRDDVIYDLTFESSNKDIASVDDDGVITGLKSGEAIVKIKTNSGVYADCYVTVLSKETKVPVEEQEEINILISNNNINLTVGQTAVIDAVLSNDVDGVINYKSLNSNVASVSNMGEVKALKEGHTTIEVSYKDKLEYVNVVVAGKTVSATSIGVSTPKREINIGEVITLKAVVSPSNANTNNISWTSSDTSVATVSKGIVKGIKAGRTRITASINGKTASVVITVNNDSSIRLGVSKNSIYVGETIRVSSYVTPYGSKVTWTSSNSNIARVSSGMVTGMSTGKVTITGKLDNGKSASISINVVARPIEVTSITFAVTNLTMNIGEVKTIKPSFSPSNATDKSVTWSTSNSSIASVSAGNIKAISAGVATITAKTSNGKKASIVINVKKPATQPQTPTINLPKISTALNTSLNPNSSGGDENTLLFGSDYQGTNAEANTKKILTKVVGDNVKPSLILILGDYHRGSTANSNSYISKLNTIFRSYDNLKTSKTLYIGGNHDLKTTSYLAPTGGYISDSYAVYTINYKDYPEITSSCTGSNLTLNNTTTSNIKKFLDTLNNANYKKPIFMVTHVPLHKSSRKKNYCAGNIVNLLNSYSKLNIIFMYGHNHSSTYDDCLGGSINYIPANSNLTYYKSDMTATTSSIKFTYLNAGYIGYDNNTNGNVKCSGVTVKSTNALSMTAFKIDSSKVVATRYTKDGVHSKNTIYLK